MAESAAWDQPAPGVEAPTPCVQQLQSGFRFLRFAAPLEQVFRSEYVDQNIDRFRSAVLLGIALIFVVAAVDFATLAPAIRAQVAGAKLVLMLPAPLLSLWLVYHRRHYRVAPLAVAVSLVLAGGAISAVHAYFGSRGQPLPYDSLLLMVLFSYFISGLLLPGSALCALAVTALAFAGDVVAGYPHKVLGYHAFHLLAANAIGLLGSWLHERTLRLNYLHTGAAEELAGLDALTNLSGPAAFRDALEARWRQAADEQVALGLLLIDVDYFRRYHEKAGRVAADQALRHVAHCVLDAARGPIDLVGRFDDDEFALLLYAVDRNRVDDTARRILNAVDAMRLHHGDSPISHWLTVSIGAHIARPEGPQGGAQFLSETHQALIEAKAADRHRARFAGDQPAAEGQDTRRAS